MSVAEAYWWNRIPSDPWNPVYWRTWSARDRRGVRRALRGLARALHAEALQRRNMIAHPLGHDFHNTVGRWRLLEIGLLLAELSDLDDYPDRLLEPSSYHAACAELQTGLLLRRLGFEIDRDPANASIPRGEGRSAGPDWRARQGGGSFGVEVKCPEESGLAIGLHSATMQALFALGSLLPPGTGIDGAIDGGAIRRATNGRWVNQGVVQDMAIEAAIDLEERGAAETELGAFVRGEGQSTLRGFPEDERYEDERVRGPLQKAAVQLASLPEAGVIVLSAARDFYLVNRCDAIATALQEDWAANIALVIVMLPMLPGLSLRTIPGRAAEHLRRFRFETARDCKRGHLHVDTFAFEVPCEGL